MSTLEPQPKFAVTPATAGQVSPSVNSAAESYNPGREDFSEYVAHLQLHMALQARNLVPTLRQAHLSVSDRRHNLLHKTQADFEKIISRQI